MRVRVGFGRGEVSRLSQAHEALVAIRPDRGASAAEWYAFHAHSAAVYAEIAEVDRGHHHEALGYWAARERQKAEEFAELARKTI